MYVNLYPFNPLANTVALAVAVTTANVQLPVVNASGLAPNLIAVRVVNSGTQVVWVTFGPTNAVTAAIPASTANGPGFPMMPNTERVFLVQNGSFMAIIAAATGSTIYATPGESE